MDLRGHKYIFPRRVWSKVDLYGGREKFLKFVYKAWGINDFKVPPCWISDTHKRDKKAGINLRSGSKLYDG